MPGNCMSSLSLRLFVADIWEPVMMAQERQHLQDVHAPASWLHKDGTFSRSSSREVGSRQRSNWRTVPARRRLHVAVLALDFRGGARESSDWILASGARGLSFEPSVWRVCWPMELRDAFTESTKVRQRPALGWRAESPMGDSWVHVEATQESLSVLPCH